MYAIQNKKSKKWVYGTDYRCDPRKQRTSFDRALTYEHIESAEIEFMVRGCGKDYKIVPVKLEVKANEY